MLKSVLIITRNILIILIILEFGFRIYDLSRPDYFDNKKSIISYYSNITNHPFINYTSRQNTAGKQIHSDQGDYFQTTTNNDGFRSKKFLPKLDGTFRIFLLGDSFIYGMNANDSETLGFQLEKNYQKNISKKIEVLSFGVAGYSPINYVGIARTYFDYLKPDLVIILITQGDFEEDAAKVKNYDYQYDDDGYPYFIKNYSNINHPIKDLIKNKSLIHKLKLESALFNKLNYLRHKIKNIMNKKKSEKIFQEKIPYLDYEKLTKNEKKDLFKTIKQNPFLLRYDLESSKIKYKATLKFLEYVKNKSDDIDAKILFSNYPFAWHINPEYSKLFQIKNFNYVLDFRNNHVYQDLVNYYAEELGIENLDSYDFFKKNPGKYWDDYDPHYNASGYKLYAKFLYQQTEKFIKERLSK